MGPTTPYIHITQTIQSENRSFNKSFLIKMVSTDDLLWLIMMKFVVY